MYFCCLSLFFLALVHWGHKRIPRCRVVSERFVLERSSALLYNSEESRCRHTTRGLETTLLILLHCYKYYSSVDALVQNIYVTAALEEKLKLPRKVLETATQHPLPEPFSDVTIIASLIGSWSSTKPVATVQVSKLEHSQPCHLSANLKIVSKGRNSPRCKNAMRIPKRALE